MRLIILFLLLSLGADAQIIRANAFYRPTAAAAQFLLDAYPNAAAAYSLRKLKASYSGSAIRIRRDSTGNAETDIGFTANGDLDTAAIKTHCRNNSCMVTTWYNQGDSTAIDFTQTTAASQPRIMTSGVIERRAGEPTIRFDNSGTSDFMSVASSTVKFNYLHKAGQAAVFIIIEITTAGTKIKSIINNNELILSTRIGYGIAYNDSTITKALSTGVTRGALSTFVSLNQPQNFIYPDTLNLITNLLDNSTGTAANRNILYKNGANEKKLSTNTNAASTANASFNFTLGRRTNTNDLPLDGYVSEIIIYPTDQTSNRTGIETNINNYYGLW